MAREILICAVQFDKDLRSGAMSVVELASIAAHHATQGVEYRDVYWKDKANELPVVRREMDARGLKSTYATFTTLYNRDEAKRRQLLEDLDDAHALGSPLLRVFRGDPPGDGPEDAAVRDGALSVVERAGEYGMRLALENHVGGFGWRLSDVFDTIQAIDSPVMGANIDIANYVVNGEDPTAAIRALRPWIIYAHLKDVKTTAKGMEQTYLGDGSLPMGELIGAIEGVGRPIPLCFEFGGGDNPNEAIARSLATISRL